MEWISFKESSPPENTKIKVKGSNCIGYGFYMQERGERICNGKFEKIDESLPHLIDENWFTHWMPLPKPPESIASSS